MFRPVHARTLSIYYLFRVASRQGSYDINIIYIYIYIQCFIRDRGETRIIYNAHIKQGRRRVPPVALRHLSRMPPQLQAMHQQWTVRTSTVTDLDRGVALATTMVAAGDDTEVVERQLLAVGVSPAAAIEALAHVTARTAPR